jgi:hypothetical protein
VYVGGVGVDRLVGEYLAALLSLKRLGYPSNLVNEELTFRQAVQRTAYRAQGLNANLWLHLGQGFMHGVAQVKGGCAGSLLRCAYAQRISRVLSGGATTSDIHRHGKNGFLFSSLNTAIGKWNGAVRDLTERELAVILLAGRTGARDLLTSDFLEWSLARIAQSLQYLRNWGIPRENLLDAHYTFDRGWRHNGFSTQLSNWVRPTYEPLNDVVLSRAAMALSPADRMQGRLGDGLVREFADERASNVPYVSTETDLRAVRELFSDCSIMGFIREARAAVRNSQISPMDTVLVPNQRRNYRNAGGTGDQELIGGFIVEAMGALGCAHRAWDVLDRKAIFNLATSVGFRRHVDCRSIISLLCWALGDLDEKPFEVPMIARVGS